VFNSSPIDEWGETVAEFWTWAGGDKILWDQASLGTWIQVLLGFVVMIVAFIGFVKMENGKLERQADALRATGALDRPPDPSPAS
jgi:hypothetical protein